MRTLGLSLLRPARRWKSLAVSQWQTDRHIALVRMLPWRVELFTVRFCSGFVQAFQEKLQSMGAQLSKLFTATDLDLSEMDKFFRQASMNGIDYALCIVPEKKDQLLKGAALRLTRFRFASLPFSLDSIRFSSVWSDHSFTSVYCLVADLIKLAEYRYQIVTQCVRSNIARDVSNPSANGRAQATLANLVAKANMKLGGTNYALITQPSNP